MENNFVFTDGDIVTDDTYREVFKFDFKRDKEIIYRLRFATESEKEKCGLADIGNDDLLEYFAAAIRDAHYSPCGKKENESGYSLQILQEEINIRINGVRLRTAC